METLSDLEQPAKERRRKTAQKKENPMETYRFIGAFAYVGGKQLDTLGQTVQLEPEVANDGIAKNIAILPEAAFLKLGITAEEMKAHPTPQFQEHAPKEVQDKLTVARQTLHDLRTALQNPAPLPETKEPATKVHATTLAAPPFAFGDDK